MFCIILIIKEFNQYKGGNYVYYKENFYFAYIESVTPVDGSAKR
jgi:hypothetical protein